MKDTIYRQEAIEAARESTKTSVLCSLRAERALNELPAAQRWIPCSERLPEEDTEVFIYLFDRPDPYIAWVNDGRWHVEEFEIEKEDYPTAWMPLPEPYQGGE